MFAFSYAPQSLVHWEMYFANDEPFTPVRPEMSARYYYYHHCSHTGTSLFATVGALQLMRQKT